MDVIARLKNKTIRMGLRTRIVILVVSLLLFLAVSLMIQTVYSITPFLNEQLELQGFATAKYISDRIPEYIYREDLFMLYTIIRDTKNSNMNIRYIFILDEKNQVMVDTFGNAIPKGLKEANNIIVSQSYNVSVINTDEGEIRDIALPISGGKMGAVRIGMSQNALITARAKMLEGIALTTLAVVLLGTVLALYLSLILAKPYQRLILATREVAAGNMKFRIPAWKANDEAGELIQAFNEMTEQIERSAQEIEQLCKMRQGLAQKVMDIQEEERKWLSRELHDETSQSLASLKIGLRHIEDAENMHEARQRSDEARMVLDETFNNIRRLVTSLRPSVLDEGGLSQAITRYTRELQKRFNIEINLDLEENFALSQEVASSLFRIVQEALTNCVRHANASQISVILNIIEADLHLIIEDDGEGFDVAKVLPQRNENQKYGIFGMQERVSILGGKLQVESTLGGGTTLYVKIPEEVLIRGKNKGDTG